MMWRALFTSPYNSGERIQRAEAHNDGRQHVLQPFVADLARLPSQAIGRARQISTGLRPLCRKKMASWSAGPKCGNCNNAADPGRRWDEMEGRYQCAVLAPYKSGALDSRMVCFLRHRGRSPVDAPDFLNKVYIFTHSRPHPPLWYALADVTGHGTGCRLPQETMCRNILDDVASNVSTEFFSCTPNGGQRISNWRR